MYEYIRVRAYLNKNNTVSFVLNEIENFYRFRMLNQKNLWYPKINYPV